MRTIASLIVAAAGLASAAASAQIINIDASHGFTFDGGGSDPAPVPGQHINLIGTPVQLTLGPGTYEITNAFGQPGALFSAWSYNVGAAGWAWAFVVADDATRNTLLYGQGGLGSSAAEVAALASVQNFSATFSLASTQTLDFTLRDYYVPDNAGGVSLKISQVSAPGVPAVPEPATVALMLGGICITIGAARRRRR